MTDAHYMGMVLKLAGSARGQTSPNPMVGCVIVRNGEVLATGVHQKAGQAHAEAMALAKLGGKAEGATVYVNLEPCSHHGRTPPCAHALVRAGVGRVVIGMIDPFEQVNGTGLKFLQNAGVAVDVGLLQGRCTQLNEAFIHFVQRKRPFVTLKSAITVDGRVATQAGASQWITSDKARRDVHKERSFCDAVIVGTGTVLADDCQLTVRLPRYKGKQPTRVVLDRSLRIPLAAKVFDTSVAPTLLCTSEPLNTQKALKLTQMGVDVCSVDETETGLDLRQVLNVLGQRNIVHSLVECGPTLAASFFKDALVERCLFYIAPKLFGGQGARSVVGELGVLDVDDGPQFDFRQVRRLGPDLKIEAIPKYPGRLACLPA